MTLPAPDKHKQQPFGAPPRPLAEDVMQTAEQAVLTNPASADAVPPQVFPDESGEDAEDEPVSLSYTDSIAAYVARQPVQSALLAVAAGALLAAAVTAAIQRNRR